MDRRFHTAASRLPLTTLNSPGTCVPGYPLSSLRDFAQLSLGVGFQNAQFQNCCVGIHRLRDGSNRRHA